MYIYLKKSVWFFLSCPLIFLEYYIFLLAKDLINPEQIYSALKPNSHCIFPVQKSAVYKVASQFFVDVHKFPGVCLLGQLLGHGHSFNHVGTKASFGCSSDIFVELKII